MNSSDKNRTIDSKEDSFENKNGLKESLNKGLSFSDDRRTRSELFDEKTLIEEQSLQSSKETLGLILESEKIGVKTGRELVRQRETLHRVEDRLVSIDGSLVETQKHLKSMKSIFGGLFSKKKQNASKFNKSSDNRDFLQEINEYEIKSMNSSKNIHLDVSHQKTFNVECNGNESTYCANNLQNDDFKHQSNDIDDKIEDNLNQIDLGIERLKQLSLGLGQEIDSQNCLIDRISKQTEKAELNIKEQNKQMNHILRK